MTLQCSIVLLHCITTHFGTEGKRQAGRQKPKWRLGREQNVLPKSGFIDTVNLYFEFPMGTCGRVGCDEVDFVRVPAEEYKT